MMGIATIKELEDHFDFKFEKHGDFACSFCQFETVELGLYAQRATVPLGEQSREENAALCTICSTTMAGNAHQYPDQYRNESKVMQMLAFCTNTIIKAVEAKGE